MVLDLEAWGRLVSRGNTATVRLLYILRSLPIRSAVPLISSSRLLIRFFFDRGSSSERTIPESLESARRSGFLYLYPVSKRSDIVRMSSETGTRGEIPVAFLVELGSFSKPTPLSYETFRRHKHLDAYAAVSKSIFKSIYSINKTFNDFNNILWIVG